ncbi:MAG TPA: Mur ligase family protein [Actinomycetota bacterium]|nr:Mur ligase family protein [Actinomycetota bacterium]
MARGGGGSAVEVVELRVLDGPNLFFTRPAIQLTLAVPWYLAAPEERMLRLAQRIRMPGADSPGRMRVAPPGSDRRLRFTARVARHVGRRLADATGTALAVRGRAGPEPEQVVVAFPWRHRTAAEAFAEAVADVLAELPGSRKSLDSLLSASSRALEGVEPGPSPDLPDPSIPVIAVTGTNGKTTTVRLLAHIGRQAGLTVAHSCTDGVYLDEELVEGGDYSGFGGAARALAQPGVQLAILETARGGMLLRGVGTAHNDVAVVTNVSADHLGLRGIRTLDQLAEVKSTIVRITRPDGWDVLNADDPRVLDMRRVATGRPWLFSVDPDHPALRSALDDGGRGMTVIDGRIALLSPRADPRPLVALEEVPVTLAGVSSHNVQNAMGAAAAALGAGVPRDAVVRGLKTFVLDPERNPGRTNLFRVDGRTIVVDYAHNEAGMGGLVEVCAGLRPPGGDIWIAFGTAGDRSDEILHAIGYVAGRGADHVAIAELRRYLRGREAEDIVERLRAGSVDGGATEVPVYPDEVTALTAMLDASRRGDVVAVTALSQRPEIFASLDELGASRPAPGEVRRLVRRARGAGTGTSGHPRSVGSPGSPRSARATARR